MSAIWGLVKFDKDNCQTDSMSFEYERKCKLDRINEIKSGNSLLGFGLQIITNEDETELMPYILDTDGNILDTDSDPKKHRAIIVADCIIDNRDELIAELLNVKDTSISNGRLICLAYKKWNTDLVHYLKGIYSVAIFDICKEQLFIFTDRTSSRCLYYYKTPSEVVFSTLISPIKMLYPELKRNETYLKDFLLLPGLMPNISSTETPWKNVFIVEAGCSVTITKDSCIQTRYWSPEKINLPKDIDKLKNIFLDTYKNAVKRVVTTNGQVGIALSGGFDSASVATLAAPLLQYQDKNLFSYTYVPHYNMSGFYPKNQITNESGYVNEIVKMYPNIKPTYTDNGGKSFYGYVDELVDVMEIPFKAFVNLPLLLEIYKSAAKKGCKVFLNGQTGNASVSFGAIEDTIYDLYRRKRYFSLFTYLSNYCKEAGISRAHAFSVTLKLISAMNKEDGGQQELTKELLNKFVNSDLLTDYRLQKRNQTNIALNFSEEPVCKRENITSVIYTLPALSYIGAMETKLGLYTGIVIRDATRDMDILNFCNSFPFEYYCYKGTPRYLIRGFMKDLLPRCILYPILKTGIQSSDWIYRLTDEKGKIINDIKEKAMDAAFNKYLNQAAIKEFLDTAKDFNLQTEGEYLYLFIAYIFMRFMQ